MWAVSQLRRMSVTGLGRLPRRFLPCGDVWCAAAEAEADEVAALGCSLFGVVAVDGGDAGIELMVGPEPELELDEMLSCRE